jgi:prolipoprotein diacylglyceryltransferase
MIGIGIGIGIGIAVGLLVDAREADRTGIRRETVYRLATWLIIFGTIFTGCAVLLVYASRHRLPFWRLLDTLVVGLPLGQVFGRIGNMINGDIVGYPTSSLLAFVYTNPHAFIDPAELNRPVFPAALIEFLASLLIVAILWVLRTRLRVPGMLTVVYLVAYSVSQFIVFFWRANSITLVGLKQAQLTAIVVAAACDGRSVRRAGARALTSGGGSAARRHARAGTHGCSAPRARDGAPGAGDAETFAVPAA